MLPRLPVETIERIISFLDVPTLRACALTCHALLPAARTHLWRALALPMNYLGAHHPHSAALLKMLKDAPHLPPYVRALALNTRAVTALHAAGPAWHRHDFRPLVARFPNLRALTLCNFAGRARVVCEMLALARGVPRLEELRLENMRVNEQEDPEVAVHGFDARLDEAGPKAWQLKRLAVVGGYVPPAVLVWLVSFLERPAEETGVAIESLDLRSGRSAADALPAVWPGVPSFAPSLKHFGIALKPDGGPSGHASLPVATEERIPGILTALPHYRSLRSLCIQYDLHEALAAVWASPDLAPPPALHASPSSPCILDSLARVLSGVTEQGAFPLERLTLVFLCPPRWLVLFRTEFERLAEALCSDSDGGGTVDINDDGSAARRRAKRRYPGFARLEVRTDVLLTVARGWGPTGPDEYAAKVKVGAGDGEGEEEGDEVVVRRMLQPFVRADVVVDVALN
ncbi:hypothetical protein OH77DRAFT_833985 [Trametes cingulata]|nr:hypothetical protein OH77DRAFT_833985 [Trametes cingulata]